MPIYYTEEQKRNMLGNMPQLNLQTQPMQNIYGGTSFPTLENRPLNLTPEEKSLKSMSSTANTFSKNAQLYDGANVNGGVQGNFSNYAAKGAAVIGGIAGLYGTYQDLSKIGDTSQQWNEINKVEDLGTRDYTEFDQLLNDYSSLDSMNKSFSYRDIRGKSDGQLAMGVGSSILQGAAAGASFGPYGAAAGAVIGLGAGLAGVATGNAKARLEKLRLENGAKMAEENARLNLDAANESIAEYKFRAGVSRRAAWGGPIERRNQSIKEYADRILHNKPKQISAEGKMHSIKRSHCNGGTMIRIKR